MRIALLADFPLHVIPGLERFAPAGHYATWLPQLAEAFAEQEEFEIHWLTVTRRLPPPEPVRWRGQMFHFLHSPGRLRQLHGWRRECEMLQRRVAELAPALVHAWGTEACYGLAGAGCGRPWLLSMQGILLEYRQRCRMPALAHLQAFYEWFALRRAQQISVESRWGREVMARRAPQARLHQVEYGVPALFFDTPWQPDPARPVALFSGTPEPRKGLQDAVAAFGDPALAGYELQVVGDAENAFARELKQHAPPNVRWLGRLSRADCATALSQAWCLVLPTRADTSPNVVKEARVIGLPVVTSPDGGQSDYIHDGENGFIAQPGDLATLTRGLRTLLGSLPTAQKMGASRWPEQRAFFRPERTAEGFLALYRKLLR